MRRWDTPALTRARNHHAISSICHLDVGRGRRQRSSRANSGPNFNTHRRTSRKRHSAHAPRADLSIAMAERDADIQPNRVPDLVAGKRNSSCAILPAERATVLVTEPPEEISSEATEVTAADTHSIARYVRRIPMSAHSG